MSQLERTLKKIFPQDHSAREAARNGLNQLTSPHLVTPHPALGELAALAIDLAGCATRPRFSRRGIVLMAADHGVAEEQVSSCSATATDQMVRAILAGGGAINALAGQCGAQLFVVDMGVAADLRDLAGGLINKKVALGSGNIAVGPAMSAAMARRSVESGIDVADSLLPDCDLIGIGALGRGNSIAATAIAAVCCEGEVALPDSCETGNDDARLDHTTDIIRRALQINQPNARDGLDILAKVGGFEIGGLAGLILGAAAQRRPVLVDGLVATAGALIAARLEPFVRDFLIFAHSSAEPAGRAMQAALGCRHPLLDLGLYTGDGCGAALAMPLVTVAASLLSPLEPSTEAAFAAAEREIQR